MSQLVRRNQALLSEEEKKQLVTAIWHTCDGSSAPMAPTCRPDPT